MTPLETRIGLHTWTLDTTPFVDVLRIARETGYTAIEVRWIDFQRCNCEVMMIAPGSGPATNVEDAAHNFAAACSIAAKHGLLCALEYGSRHPVLNRLAIAREIVALADRPNAGLLIDTYHAQAAGEGGRGFAVVPAGQIIAFQFSDVPAHPPAATAGGPPLDRLPPGEGTVRWREVLQLLMQKNYARYINYEAPNPALWQRPAAEVAKEGITRIRELIAQSRTNAGGG